MEKYITENQDWKLGAFIDWKPKSHSEKCSYCGGGGQVGGGFKSIDGPQDCPTCFGSGFVTKWPTSQPPEIPPELIEHMRRAWWDFHHSNTGDV